LVRPPIGNVPALEKDLAGPAFEQAGDGLERGRLARAIRPDQGDDVALVNLL